MLLIIAWLGGFSLGFGGGLIHLLLVIALHNVYGWIDVQGRANDSGVTVTLTGTYGPYTAVTVSGGGFSMYAPAGDYVIVAEKPLYLSMRRVVTVSGTTLLPTKILYGGDCNDDGTINTTDMDIANAQFGLGCSTTPPMTDSRADVNADCIVNIQDVSLIGGNNGKVEPLAW